LRGLLGTVSVLENDAMQNVATPSVLRVLIVIHLPLGLDRKNHENKPYLEISTVSTFPYAGPYPPSQSNGKVIAHSGRSLIHSSI
jgi:hypothetical protein